MNAPASAAVEHPAVTALYVECASGEATPRSLAVAYAMVIGALMAGPHFDLRPVEAAMCHALSDDIFELDAVTVMAWDIYYAMCERRRALALAAPPSPAADATGGASHG